jgi:hypothetical protein
MLDEVSRGSLPARLETFVSSERRYLRLSYLGRWAKGLVVVRDDFACFDLRLDPHVYPSFLFKIDSPGGEIQLTSIFSQGSLTLSFGCYAQLLTTLRTSRCRQESCHHRQ